MLLSPFQFVVGTLPRLTVDENDSDVYIDDIQWHLSIIETREIATKPNKHIYIFFILVVEILHLLHALELKNICWGMLK